VYPQCTLLLLQKYEVVLLRRFEFPFTLSSSCTERTRAALWMDALTRHGKREFSRRNFKGLLEALPECSLPEGKAQGTPLITKPNSGRKNP